MEIFTMEANEIEADINKGFAQGLLLLKLEGKITDDEFEYYRDNYAIIMKKPAWWKKLDIFNRNNKEKFIICTVKRIT